jgi:hypothetical protein
MILKKSKAMRTKSKNKSRDRNNRKLHSKIIVSVLLLKFLTNIKSIISIFLKLHVSGIFLFYILRL